MVASITQRFFSLLTKSFPFFFFILVLPSCASVKTQQSQYRKAIPLVREGNYQEAAKTIKEARGKQYKEKDRVLYYLDLGMLYHWMGEYAASNNMLTEAENAIEELFTQSISKSLGSVLLNDNALDYGGEDYEDIYINIFKALNYIALDKQESALVEIRRVHIKLALLEDKYKRLVEEYNASEDAETTFPYPKNRFHNDVLARYIGILLYRTEASYDDARIEREAIDTAWLQQAHLYNFPQPPMPALRLGEENLAHVNVLSFSGLSPVKLGDTFYLTTGPNIVYLSMAGQEEDYITELVGFSFLIIPGIEPGIHFKIQFPRLEKRPSSANRVILKLNGKAAVSLPKIEDIGKIAQETFLLKQPLTVGKTIVRATIKNIAKELGKKATRENLKKQENDTALLLGFFVGIAADIAVNATENADLRISQFFPASAHATEITVLPGVYEVSMEYWNGDVLIAETHHGSQFFKKGELNFIESYILQ